MVLLAEIANAVADIRMFEVIDRTPENQPIEDRYLTRWGPPEPADGAEPKRKGKTTAEKKAIAERARRRAAGLPVD